MILQIVEHAKATAVDDLKPTSVTYGGVHGARLGWPRQ
jgi:hypothetical protein